MKLEFFGRPLLAAFMAVIPAEIGWIAVYLSDKPHPSQAVLVLGLLLLTPGWVVAGSTAWILSPQGLHGIDKFFWLSVPVSWLFYFLLFSGWLGRAFRWRPRSRIPRQGE